MSCLPAQPGKVCKRGTIQVPIWELGKASGWEVQNTNSRRQLFRNRTALQKKVLLQSIMDAEISKETGQEPPEDIPLESQKLSLTQKDSELPRLQVRKNYWGKH